MSTWKTISTKLRGPAPPATSSAPPPTALSLLIVDDDPEMHATLKAIFDEAGYRILTASSGDEALDVLRGERQERLIILLDSSMPGLDGEGVLRAILRDRQMRRRHAVILVSAMPHLSRRLRLQRLLQSLAIETITKPFNIADLEQAVERARAKLWR